MLFAGVVVTRAQAANAAAVPSGTFSNWFWPATAGGHYNIDQRLTVLGHTAGAHYFWAHQFKFATGDGGYLGLQVGSNPNNSKIALFSIWGATAATGPNCGPFTEGGAGGYTCRLDPYNWVTGRAYRMRLWAVNKDSAGEWWGAWVQDTVTGTDSHVGTIRVPLGWGWLGTWSVSWTEHFGAAPATCDDLPWAKAQFDFPTANAGAVALSSHTHHIGTTGTCPEYAKVVDAGNADVQEMGRSFGSVELLKPTLVHANGAELQWTRLMGVPFDRYEVHRSATAGFTPTAATRLTTIRDAGTTTWRDTTAAPAKTFYYKVTGNTAVSSQQIVTTPATGKASLVMQPGATAGKATFVTADRTSSPGCYDSYNYGAETVLRIGTGNGGQAYRPLLWFDLREIPVGARVSNATLKLSYDKTSAPMASTGRGINLHRLTHAWAEGNGVFPGACTGTGASWNDTKGGVRWSTAGGDLDAVADASVGPKARGTADGADSFAVTPLVQEWVNGTPNHGLLLRLADESVPTDNPYFDYHSDNAADPIDRPELTITFDDGSATQAPWAVLTQPAAGSIVRGSAVPLAAGSGDDGRVAKVEFLVNGAVMHTDSQPPFDGTWNTTSLTSGGHTVSARATDDAGNVVTSGAVSVTVANSASPTVALASPADGATVTGTVTIAASATDDRSVSTVEFYADGHLVGTDTTAPYSATWNTLAWPMLAYDGPHVLSAKAYDGDGQLTNSLTRTVNTANTAGTRYRASFDIGSPGPADDVLPSLMAPAAGVIPTDPYASPSPRTITSAPDDSLAVPASGCPAEAYCPTLVLRNDSAQTWNGATTKVWYRWSTPDGFLLSEGKARTALPASVAPGASVTVSMLIASPAPTAGAELGDYRLLIDVYDHAAGKWFGLSGNKPVENAVAVAKDLNNALGLEKFWTYEGEEVGAGSTALTNVANGNMLWRWDPWMSVGRGLSSVLSVTYNAMEDHSRSPLGNNFSLAISGLTRFGEPLDIHPNKADQISGRSNKFVVFTDGDGTAHRFTGNADGTWSRPPGVHLYLRPVSTDPANPRYWALSRPDNVTFYYDVDGFPTAIIDRNGNTILFVLENVPPGEDPGGPKKRIIWVADPGGRAYIIDYFSKDEAKQPHVRGKIQRITDHSGRALDFSYYDDGNLLRLTQAGGAGDDGRRVADRTFVFTYTTSSGDGPAIPVASARVNPDPKMPNQSTRIFSIRDPRGQETTFDYHGPSEGAQLRWKLQSRRNRAGDVTNFAYDLTSRETRVVAPLGRTTAYRYDAQGKATAVVNPKGEVNTFEWSPDFKIAKIIEPNGAVTAISYNDNGYMTSRTDQLGNTTRLDYENRRIDAGDPGTHWSLLSQVTLPEGVATTATGDFEYRFAYDAAGNLLTQTEPGGFLTRYTWNLAGSSAPGTIATVTDPRGGVTQLTDYDPNGLPQKVIDPEGGVSRFGYSPDGLLRFSQTPLHEQDQGQADVRAYRTYIDYDPFRRQVRQSEPKTISGDRGLLVWLLTRYDANDNTVAQANAVYGRDEPGTAPETTAAFDAMDRPVSVLGPDRTVPGGELSTMRYDAAGRLVATIAARGSATATADDFTTKYSYDGADRLTLLTRNGAAGEPARVTAFCYDNVGNRTQVIAPNAGLTSAPSCPVATTTPYLGQARYDLAHRLVETTNPLGHKVSTAYNRNGWITAVTDANGKVTTTRYDQRGKVVETISPYVANGRTLTTRYEYDQAGNLVKQISPRAVDKATTTDYVTVFSYDRLNRLTRKALPKDAGIDASFEHYGYDADSRLIRKTLPVTDQQLSTVGPNARTDITYHDIGWVATTDDPGNPQVLHDYTAEGWTSVRTPKSEDANTSPPDLSQQMRWTYQNDGMLASRVDRGGFAATYAYDVDNNLVRTTTAAGVTSPDERPITTAFTYNGFGQIVRAGTTKLLDDSAQRVELYTTYGYDRDGNLTSRGDDGKAGAEVVAVKRNQFVYDGADRLVTQFELGRDTSCAGDRRITQTWTQTTWLASQTVANATAACPAEQSADPAAWQTTQKQERHYNDNGLLGVLATFNGAGEVKEAHFIGYEQDGAFTGQRTTDTFVRQGPVAGKPCQATACTETMTYDARGRITRHDNGAGGVTTFTLDAAAAQRDGAVRAGNVTREAAPGGTFDRTYLGNRLETQTVGGVTAKHWYDSLGRLDCITTPAGQQTDCSPSAQVSANLITDYAYDYLDRLESVRTYQGGQATDEATYRYDALDRVTTETEMHKRTGTMNRRTDFAYLGTTRLPSSETVSTSGSTSSGTVPDTTNAKSYSYDAYGVRVHMTDQESTKQPDGTWLAGTPTSVTFAHDPHTSVSLILHDQGPNAGKAKAAYGYTPYGESDATLSDGDTDKLKPFNPYRYTGHRFDSGSQTLDTGARRYSPGTGRFLQQDLFFTALGDLGLTLDPLSQNRYALAGGNPTSFIEYDGHGTVPNGSNGTLRPPTIIESDPARAGDMIVDDGKGVKYTVPKGDRGVAPENISTRNYLNEELAKTDKLYSGGNGNGYRYYATDEGKGFGSRRAAGGGGTSDLIKIQFRNGKPVGVRSVDLYQPRATTSIKDMTSYLRAKLTQADEVVVEMRGGSESRAKALLDETKDLGFKSRRIIKKEGHDQFDIERDDGDPGNWPDNGGDGTCLASFGGEGEYAGPAQQCGYDSEGNYVPLPPGGFFPLPNPGPVPVPGPVPIPLPV